MSELPAIETRGLSKQYTHRSDEPPTFLQFLRQALSVRRSDRAGDLADDRFWALDDVTFSVGRGERIGVIGRNGAGKTTLLRMLARVVAPTRGEARLYGRVTALLGVGTGFNANFTGRENIYLNASIHGLTRQEIDDRLEEIVEFSGIREFIDTSVRHYSSGMYMRLAFSVAAHLDPDILLLDEILSVGDVSFQKKCMNRVEGLTSDGRTVLFVSHNLSAVSRLCERVIWIEQGRLVMDGSSEEVTDAYFKEVSNVRSSWSGRTESRSRSGAANSDGSATSPAQSSPAIDRSPGRILSARVVDGERRSVNSVRIDERVGIELTYEVRAPGYRVQPALYFDDATGVRAFVAAYTDSQYFETETGPGRYRTTAWIPPNLLNEGPLYVTICLASPDPFERLDQVEQALSLRVREAPLGTRSIARGLYAGKIPGVVRPLLEWETDFSPSEAAVEQLGSALKLSTEG